MNLVCFLDCENKFFLSKVYIYQILLLSFYFLSFIIAFLAFIESFNVNTLTFIVLITTLYVTFFRNVEGVDEKIIFLAILVLRLYYVILLSRPGADPDPDGYEIRALAMISKGIVGWLKSFTPGSYFYSWIVAFLFLAFGKSLVLVRYFNVFLGSLSVYLIYKLSFKIWGKASTKTFLVYSLFYPSAIVFSAAFPNREPLFVFSTSLYIYLTYSMLSRRFILIKSLIALMFLGIALTIHIGGFPLIIIYIYVIILSISNLNTSKEKKFLIALSFLVLSTVLVFFFIYQTFFGFLASEKLSILNEFSFEKIEKLQGMYGGRAAYLQNLRTDNPILFVLYLPIRLAFFLYAPFPWMIRTFIDIYGVIDSIIVFLLSNKIVVKVRTLKKTTNESFDMKKVKWTYVTTISLVLSLLVFSSIISNYGAAIRQRAKFYLLYSLLAVPLAKNQTKHYYKRLNANIIKT